MRIIKVCVQLQVPSGAFAADVCEYITTALKSEAGARDPRDPMFNLRRESVKIVHYNYVRKDKNA